MTIPKGATDGHRFSRPALFYGSAREAFRDFLRHAPAEPGLPVLLPEFIGWSPREGSGVFDPVGELGLPAEFYRLRRDLTVDVDDVAQRLESGRFRALVVIHYYGRTEPALAELGALARTYEVPLLEDSAHAFFSAEVGGVAGTVGSMSLYSLHKMFPLARGGAAVYRDPVLLRGQAGTAPELAGEILSFDWRAIADTRRRNFLAATELLRAAQQDGAPLELLWPALTDTDVPQSLPVYVLTDTRDRLYEQLNAAGLGVVSLYHTLIPQLRRDHPEAAWAAAHILNLPVHQDVEPPELFRLVDSLVSSLPQVGSRR